MDPVARKADMVGDDAVEAATGRPRAAWLALLDAAGAQTWPHPRIAAWLTAEHGVEGWWAQGLTVDYEQARGLRRPGQRADGTFAAGVTRTVDLTVPDAARALVETVAAQLGVPAPAVNLAAKNPTGRFPMPGGESLLAAAGPAAGGRASASLTWERMPDDTRVAEVKERMRGWLALVG